MAPKKIDVVLEMRPPLSRNVFAEGAKLMPEVKTANRTCQKRPK